MIARPQTATVKRQISETERSHHSICGPTHRREIIA